MSSIPWKLNLKILEKYSARYKIAFLLLIISVIAQEIFVARYSVNVLYLDQFDLVHLITSKAFQWQLYFSQHSEHRMFFPELLSVFLARLTKWNVQIEIFFNWILLQGFIVLLYQILKEDIKREDRWLIILSLCFFLVPQYLENLLWGNQGYVQIILLVIAAGILALRYMRNIFLRLSMAFLCCVIASFSQANGLASWFALFPLVIVGRKMDPEPSSQRKIILSISWFAIGIGVYILYFWNFNIQMSYHLPVAYPWKYPAEFLVYFFVLIGRGSLAGVLQYPFSHSYLYGIFGLILCGIFLYCSFFDRLQFRKNLSKFCLLFFLLLSSCLISVGRANFSLWQALSSRYSEFSALVPVVMLAMLISSRAAKNIFGKIIFVFLLAIILVNIPFGWFNSIKDGRLWYVSQQNNAELLVHYNIVSDTLLTRLYPYPSALRNKAAALKDLGYNVFSK